MAELTVKKSRAEFLAKSATIRRVGRPYVITGAMETQLEALLDAGVTQRCAARALGVSLRSVSRWVANKRATTPADQTLVELFASIDDDLARALGEPPRRRRSAVRRRRRSDRGWIAAARQLEAEYPERWGPPGASD